MKSVEVDEADLLRLLDGAAAGEEVIVTRAGKPVAKLVRLEEQPLIPRAFGGWEGRVSSAP